MQNNKLTCNWQIDKSKDNKDILIINGKYIHSKIAPADEADNFKTEGRNLIVIFGMGLAYHINNIIRNNPQSYFIIYEPYKEIYDNKDNYLYILRDNNCSNKYCLLYEIDSDVIYNFIKKNELIANTRILTYSNIGYKNLLPEKENEYYNSVKNIFEIHIKNLFTENNFIPLWSKNFFYNTTCLNRIPLLSPVKNNLDKNLLVIACAGPSLIDDISVIKKYRNKLTVFAVDTAIKPLFSNNIIPDAVISLDGQYYTMSDFIKKIPQETAIIADIISYN